MFHFDFIRFSSHFSFLNNLESVTFIVAILTLWFVVDEFFERKRKVYREKVSEFYEIAYQYVKFQEEIFQKEVLDDARKILISHTTSGFFINISTCGTALFSQRDALLDLLFKKASLVSEEVMSLAFEYEKLVHGEGVSFQDEKLRNTKLGLCKQIKEDHFLYKAKSKALILFR